MTASPFNIAAFVGGATQGGSQPGGAADSRQNAAACGPAFLAILDQLFGTNGIGKPPPAPGQTQAKQGVQALDALSGNDHPLDDDQPFEALPFADLAGLNRFATKTDETRNSEESRFANAAGAGPDAATESPDRSAASLGALLAQTQDALPAADNPQSDNGTAPQATTQAQTGVSSLADQRSTSQTAGPAAPTREVPLIQQTAAPSTALGATGEASHAPAAPPGSDTAVDTVLATFGRRSDPGASAGGHLHSSQPTALAGRTDGAEPGVLANLAPENRSARPKAVGEDATGRQPGRDVQVTSDRPGRNDVDPLARLVSAGRDPSSKTASVNTTTSSAGEPLPAATGPACTSSSQTLTTVNEIGGSGALTQPGGQTLSAHSASATAATIPRPDANALAVRITQEAGNGNHRFEIALDPPELGRVDVRLEFNRDGRVTTHLLVDRNDSLDALMRDSRGLERALQAQGLKLDDGGVQYHLRDQSSFAQHDRNQNTPDPSGGAGNEADDPGTSPPPEEPRVRRSLALGGLDLTI